MRKGAVGRTVGWVTLLFVLGAGNALASITTYYGCFNCKPIHPTSEAATCNDAGVLQGGSGWICYEDNTFPWPDGPACWTNAQACTNGGDGGGGVGGTGGGGNSTCTTAGFCPAQCFSCSGGGGRPAI
jgi:hypothetical protein